MASAAEAFLDHARTKPKLQNALRNKQKDHMMVL